MCEHLSASDHRVAGPTGEKWWRCSACGTVAAWGSTWGFYGKDECADCGRDVITWVACSEACRRLRTKMGGMRCKAKPVQLDMLTDSQTADDAEDEARLASEVVPEPAPLALWLRLRCDEETRLKLDELRAQRGDSIEREAVALEALQTGLRSLLG